MADHIHPLLLTPLHARMEDQHTDIEPGLAKCGSFVGQDDVGNENLGIAWFHARGGIGENSCGVDVRPVVQNRLEEVGLRAFDRVRSEKVVLEPFYPGIQVFDVIYDLWLVFECESAFDFAAESSVKFSKVAANTTGYID